MVPTPPLLVLSGHLLPFSAASIAPLFNVCRIDATTFIAAHQMISWHMGWQSVTQPQRALASFHAPG